MSLDDTRVAARVSSVSFGKEDHGILTSYVHCEGTDGGWGQGFGGLGLDEEHGAAWKAALLDLFGVKTLDEIAGRNCFVLRSFPGYGADIEGLEVDGRRFTITEFRRKHWPGKEWDPLVMKRQRLLDHIESLARRQGDLVRDVNTSGDGYVDWSKK